MTENAKKIILANPRGFCAGVDRAINIVERALQEFGAPIYVRHEVVHNKFVVDNLKNKGVIFIEDLQEVPENATLIYSAHGVSVEVQKEAEQRGFKIFDATCPLVTKVHREVQRLHDQGYYIIMIGHKGHPEVEGTMGQVDADMALVETVQDVANIKIPNTEKLAHVSQTTLSIDETQDIIDALKQRFPNIKGPNKDDICYATQNRQDAVKDLTTKCDVIIVVGSPNSSNSNRLREVAALRNIPAYMVDNVSFLEKSWFDDKYNIGLTAGASAPEILVTEVLEKLKNWGFLHIEENSGAEENIVFVLPKELRTND
ncbi:4-hydroxy-3-methylbut-2-enyl diphosphate reductase [Neisseriaceae bacterium PsAf]|nr:4-hydroxy-3-methylbut-2-enyl diphosphate reductase [Neisseriaceae bacterium PsAf]MCV2502652.1 4-hydroxy-3-methylbut-2-enyl diphosphate reductase [Neisseriaceae bacterium]